MLSRDFLAEFKRATEHKWSQRSINPAVFGFQFQRGTLWNPGLSDDEITEYENVLGVRFPSDFRAFLRVMNGTAYPRDLVIVKQRIQDLRDSRDEITSDLGRQGFDLPSEAALVPIYGHRYVVCTSNPDQSVVLSVVVHDTDAIVYGASLQEYLKREFLGDSTP